MPQTSSTENPADTASAEKTKAAAKKKGKVEVPQHLVDLAAGLIGVDEKPIGGKVHIRNSDAELLGISGEPTNTGVNVTAADLVKACS